MARKARRDPTAADHILETTDSTVLDLIDHLLNKGVMANGDVTLGVAGIDLVYLRLSALVCAADRVLPSRPPQEQSRRRRVGPSRRLRLRR